MRQYKISKYYEDSGWTIPEYISYDSLDDMKPIIRKELEQYKQDAGYSRFSIVALPSDNIDFELVENMFAIREICELGHKVRASTKIRNRQPLKHAHVSFSDKSIQDYMVNNGESFIDILKDELNVMNITIMDDEIECSLFDYVLKPNFKTLGPKGYGKQAQLLKGLIQCTPETAPKGTIPFTADEKNELHSRLKKGETITIIGIPLTYADIEIEVSPKQNFFAASSKAGAIVLNTTLDEHLYQLGFVADFRSCVQNIRKSNNLTITDRIFLEVFCDTKKARTLDVFSYSLRRELLATDIKFYNTAEANESTAHRFYFHGGALKTSAQVESVDQSEVDDEPFYVNFWKETA